MADKDEKEPQAFDVTSATAIAFPREDQLTMVFNTKEDGTLAAVIPAGMVGSLYAKVAAEHQKLALKSDDTQSALVPAELSGVMAREEGRTGKPVLLLQIDRVFELALLVTPQILEHLEGVARLLREPPDPDRPKPQ